MLIRRKKIPERTRNFVIGRADFLCEYCLIPMSYVPDPFDIEHILPISKGGTNNIDNLANTCGGCNGYKSNRIEAADPTDGKLVPLYNPRIHIWREHFSWDDEFVWMIGLTPIGRATVSALQTNRPALINL